MKKGRTMHIGERIKGLLGVSLLCFSTICIHSHLKASLSESSVEWEQIGILPYVPQESRSIGSNQTGAEGADFARQFFNQVELTQLWPLPGEPQQEGNRDPQGCELIFFDPETKCIIFHESKGKGIKKIGAEDDQQEATPLPKFYPSLLSKDSTKGQQMSRKWLWHSIKEHLAEIRHIKARSGATSSSAARWLDEFFDGNGKLKDESYTLIRTANVSSQYKGADLAYMYIIFDSSKNCCQERQCHQKHDSTISYDLFVNLDKRGRALFKEPKEHRKDQEKTSKEYMKDLIILFKAKISSVDEAEAVKELLKDKRATGKKAKDLFTMRWEEITSQQAIDMEEISLEYKKKNLANKIKVREELEFNRRNKKRERDHEKDSDEPSEKRRSIETQPKPTVHLPTVQEEETVPAASTSSRATSIEQIEASFRQAEGLYWEACFGQALSLDELKMKARNGDNYAKAYLSSLYNVGCRGLPKNKKAAGLGFREIKEWVEEKAREKVPHGQYLLGIMYEGGLGVQRNPETAMQYYGLAAEQGHAGAQFSLAGMYAQGQTRLNQIESNEKAVEYYTHAAEQEHPGAQFKLGVLYEQGRPGLTKEDSDAKAAEYYTLAAEQGHPDAQFNLGVMYEEGRGGLSQHESNVKAVQYYTLAAEQGHAGAQFNLGVMYEEGRGGLERRESDAKAVGYYTLAAKQGHPDAQFNLGLMYEEGRGGLKQRESDAKALRYYTLAAGQGHPDAQFNLGLIYEEGRGGLEQRESDAKAVQYYTLAAEQGDAEVQFSLGLMYEEGRGGLEQRESDAEAVKWFLRAAEQGYADAQFNLGYMYEQGRGGISQLESDAKAMEYYTLAAQKGHADAQFNLGLMYEKGRARLNQLESDIKAMEYYTLAAEQGYADAQFNLGVMYKQGRGGLGQRESEIEAVKWLLRAAEQGYIDAQFNLGLMYQNGREELTKEDSDAKAVQYYTLAAEQRDVDAQFNLGVMYEQGRGGLNQRESDAKAVEYYTLAAEQGHANAKKRLDDFKKLRRF